MTIACESVHQAVIEVDNPLLQTSGEAALRDNIFAVRKVEPAGQLAFGEFFLAQRFQAAQARPGHGVYLVPAFTGEVVAFGGFGVGVVEGEEAVEFLERLGIAHLYEEFPDDHSAVDYRMDRSLPFLEKALRAGLESCKEAFAEYASLF